MTGHFWLILRALLLPAELSWLTRMQRRVLVALFFLSPPVQQGSFMSDTAFLVACQQLSFLQPQGSFMGDMVSLLQHLEGLEPVAAHSQPISFI